MTKDLEIGKHSQPELSGDDWALGPGSITWKMLRDPAVFMVGQMRNSALLVLHPPFAASTEHDTFVVDPALRFRRVGIYAYSATFGTRADAERLSHMVRTRHHQVVGIEPISRRPYQSNSEYELALTHVVQASSYLAIYEAIYGQLSREDRDQYYQEQKVPSAMLGVNPEHLPSTYDEAELFLTQARKRFAVGAQGRETLSVYDNRPYPKGTVMGDLPYVKSKAVTFFVRAVIDMAFATMCEEDRLLISINRRPKLGSKRAALASLRLLSKFMRSNTGKRYWAGYLQKRAFEIYEHALRVDDANGHKERESSFTVPDAKKYYRELPDIKKNWPGSVQNYAFGREEEGPIELSEVNVVNLRETLVSL